MNLPFLRKPRPLTGAVAFGEGGARVLVGQARGLPLEIVSAQWVAGVQPDADGLRQLQAALPPAVTHWILVAPRGSYGLHVLPRPAVPDNELRDSLRWAVAPMIDFPPEDAVIEFMAIPRAIGPEMGDSLYVVVAPRDTLRALAAPFAEADRALVVIEIAENAHRNVLARVSPAGQPACLIVPDDEGVQFSFVVDGELYLDRHIAGVLPEPDDGSSDAGRDRAFERVDDSLLRSLDVIAQSSPALSPSRILLAPGWEGAAERLRGRLSVPVEGLALDALFDFGAVPELASGRAQTRWLTALGALLREAEVRA